MEFFGNHFLVEYLDCNKEVLSRAKKIEEILLTAADKCGATYVGHESYQFEPHGASAIVLISESHISIHTWPEKNYAALDMLSCGEKMDEQALIKSVATALDSQQHIVKVEKRGF